MRAHGYREPAPLEPERSDSQPDIGRLGALRSVHAAPALHLALVGPFVISCVVASFGAACGVPILLSAATFVLTLGLLAWSPIRARGQSVALHARGVVIQTCSGGSSVAFEDVNELWLDIPALHNQAGAYLRAIRLVDYAGFVHCVPITVQNGAALAHAVMRQCTDALLSDARQAMAEGESLTFASARLDREGISIDGGRAIWSEIRLAVVSHARLHLYRQRPLLAWRTVRLDRIPNPAVLVGLVARKARSARVDDVLLAPLGDDAPRRTPAAATREGALRSIFIGGILCIGGTLVTLASFNHGHLRLLAWGPIVLGVVRLIRGAAALWSGPPR